jgi:hypothetical protein
MGGGEVHIGFWWVNLRGSIRLEDLGVDVRIILKCTLKKSVEGEWIKLAQD